MRELPNIYFKLNNGIHNVDTEQGSMAAFME